MKRQLYFKFTSVIVLLALLGAGLNSCKEDVPDDRKEPVHITPDPTKEFPLLDMAASDNTIREYEKAAGRVLQKDFHLKYFGDKPIDIYLNKSLPTITAVVYHVKFTETLTGIVAFTNEPYENAPRTLAMVKKAGFGDGKEKMVGGLLKAREWIGKGLRIRFAATEVEPSVNARSFLLITPYQGKPDPNPNPNPDPDPNPNPEPPVTTSEKAAISFETSQSSGSLNLILDADEAEQASVWVDLNNDGKKQDVEVVKNFTDYQTYPISASKISIYGKIKGFGCKGNHITKLDVTRATDLEQLSCVKNDLTTLDVSANAKLHTLTCFENKLSSLDVSKNPLLKKLECYSNPIASLDLSKNPELKVLQCYKMNLTAIDLSKNLKLSELDCSDNKLTTLDVTKNNKLEFLLFSNNKVSLIDLSHNTELMQIYCENNGLSSLQVSKAIMLMTLYANGNKFTEFDFSENGEISDLHLWDNQIDEAKMKSLLESLPVREANDKGTIILVNSSSAKEKNHYPADTPKICEAKHWNVYDYKDGANAGMNDLSVL